MMHGIHALWLMTWHSRFISATGCSSNHDGRACGQAEFVRARVVQEEGRSDDLQSENDPRRMEQGESYRRARSHRMAQGRMWSMDKARALRARELRVRMENRERHGRGCG